jgi:sulfur-oxidizing protein SoxY
MKRRLFLAAGLALVPWAGHATDAAALEAAIREAIGDAVPVEGGIELRVPALAENGAQVPLTILADSAMTEADHVRAIHVFAPRNPTPGVASFHLFPGLARAEVQTRIRVAEEQAILVLAVHADGTVRRASAALKVTRGGCLA